MRCAFFVDDTKKDAHLFWRNQKKYIAPRTSVTPLSGLAHFSLSQVTWDASGGKEGVTDWYATGYLTNYFLSLAEDELQPKFPDDQRKSESI